MSHNKKAFSIPPIGVHPSQPSRNINIIVNKIMDDGTINFDQKQQLITMVKQLSESDASKLSKVVGPIIGGGIGFIVAKFLLGLGFSGQVLFSLAGALLGSSSSGVQPPTPAFTPVSNLFNQQTFF